MPLVNTLKIYMKFHKAQPSKQTLHQFQACSQVFLMRWGGVGAGGERIKKIVKKEHIIFSFNIK